MSRIGSEVTQQKWFRIKHILYHAMQLDLPARPAYVADACAGDAELLQEVEYLLAHGEQSSLLDGSPFCDIPGLIQQSDPRRLVGQQFKDYHVLRWIASGGMGDVYLVECRRDGTTRAALKLLKARATSVVAIERFLREQQVLASFDHPFIARFIDAGLADEGLYYLVMEYVQGDSITTYCHTHDLPLNRRLKLFQRVCEAVQYAHSRLIVHRDLKPSNILVLPDETPRLLDFGGVKIIEPIPGLDTLVTLDHSQLPYTLAYASPETIRGNPVSTASDVFSLGILLYELLCGRSPYAASAASPFDLARAILEEDPPDPQVALRTQR